MKDWLGKPLLILMIIFLIAAGVSLYWLKSGPTAASADQQRVVTKYHIQLERAIKDIENNR